MAKKLRLNVVAAMVAASIAASVASHRASVADPYTGRFIAVASVVVSVAAAFMVAASGEAMVVSVAAAFAIKLTLA